MRRSAFPEGTRTSPEIDILAKIAALVMSACTVSQKQRFRYVGVAQGEDGSIHFLGRHKKART